MSENRKSSMQDIINYCRCQVVLLTPININDYILIDNPLHDAYEYLSFTHRADYLRAYIMYHHGGGYTDIKKNTFDWNPFFEKLQNSDADFIGYAEISECHIASHDDNVKNSFNKLAGNGHYIFKKQTDIARQLLQNMNEILDRKFQELKKHPGHYHPRAITGGVFQSAGFEDSKYPLGWNELLGMNFHRICFNNIGRFILGMPLPNMSSYR